MTRKIDATNWFADEPTSPVPAAPPPIALDRPPIEESGFPTSDEPRRRRSERIEAPPIAPAPSPAEPTTRRRHRAPRDRATTTADAATASPRDGSDSRPRWRRLASLLVFVVTVGVWFVELRPTWLGGPAAVLTVRGISMEPTYHYGDVIVAHRKQTYSEGDIIAFRVPAGEMGAGTVVIHRVIGGDAASGYITQGDNNPEPDEWRPVPDDVLGAARWRIPMVGRLASLFRTVPGIAMLAGLVAALLVMFGVDSRHDRRPGVRGAEPEPPLADQPVAPPGVAAPAVPAPPTHDEDHFARPPLPTPPSETGQVDPLDDLITPPPLLPLEPAVEEPTVEDEDDPIIGEYWGDLAYLAAALRRTPARPDLFDDDLERVATVDQP